MAGDPRHGPGDLAGGDQRHHLPSPLFLLGLSSWNWLVSPSSPPPLSVGQDIGFVPLPQLDEGAPILSGHSVESRRHLFSTSPAASGWINFDCKQYLVCLGQTRERLIGLQRHVLDVSRIWERLWIADGF